MVHNHKLTRPFELWRTFNPTCLKETDLCLNGAKLLETLPATQPGSSRRRGAAPRRCCSSSSDLEAGTKSRKDEWKKDAGNWNSKKIYTNYRLQTQGIPKTPPRRRSRKPSTRVPPKRRVWRLERLVFDALFSTVFSTVDTAVELTEPTASRGTIGRCERAIMLSKMKMCFDSINIKSL